MTKHAEEVIRLITVPRRGKPGLIRTLEYDREEHALYCATYRGNDLRTMRGHTRLPLSQIQRTMPREFHSMSAWVLGEVEHDFDFERSTVPGRRLSLALAEAINGLMRVRRSQRHARQR